MALTVKDVLELESLREFELIAGARGLSRPIEKTGILDYEFIQGVKLVDDDTFEKNSFVIGSLLFAKEKEEEIYTAVDGLIRMGVSAFGIKNIFFKELPEDVIELANQHDFPIFLFDLAWFEDIISDLSAAIKRADQFYLTEQKLKSMIVGELTRGEVNFLAQELGLSIRQSLKIFYCVNPKNMSDYDIGRTINLYDENERRKKGVSIYRYESGFMIFLTGEHRDEKRYVNLLEDVFAACGLCRKDFVCGSSAMKDSLKVLDHGLKEAIYAQKAAVLEHADLMCFDSIGIYQFLIPNKDTEYLLNYMYQYLDPLLTDESDQGKELLKTAQTFIRAGGNVKDTAERLFIHENTVRYRINKVHERLQKDSSEYVFFENLSAAIKLYWLKNQAGC